MKMYRCSPHTKQKMVFQHCPHMMILWGVTTQDQVVPRAHARIGSIQRTGTEQLRKRTHGQRAGAQVEKAKGAMLLGPVGKTSPQDTPPAIRGHGTIGSQVKSPRNSQHTHRVITSGSNTTKRGGNLHLGRRAAQPQAGKREAVKQGAVQNGAKAARAIRAGGAVVGEGE